MRKPASPSSCPICGVPRVARYRPFCSRRCADADLGRWLGGAYAIAGEPAGEEGDEGAAVPRATGPDDDPP